MERRSRARGVEVNRARVGQDAQTADFFAADEGRASVALVAPTHVDPATGKRVAYAPGDEPNPKNPGGISDNEVRRQRELAASAAAQKVLDAKYAAAKKAAVSKLVADQQAAAAAAAKRSGGWLGDLVSIGKAVGAVVGTAAAIVATGGAAAGVLGVVAGVGGLVTAAGGLAAVAAAGVKLADGVDKGTALAAAVQSGSPKAVVQALAPVANTLAVPGLDAGQKAALDSVKVAADRLIAAGEAGVATAQSVYAETKRLAGLGHPDAIVAIQIMADQLKARVAANVPIGQPMPLNAAQTAALAQFPALLAGPAVLSAPRPGAPLNLSGPGALELYQAAIAQGIADSAAAHAKVLADAKAKVDAQVAAAAHKAANDAARLSVDAVAAAAARLQAGIAQEAAYNAKKAAAAAAAGGAPTTAVEGLLIENDGARTGRLNFTSTSWRPATPGAAGALRGLVVTTAGRLALDTDWIAA
jgi:hypothetical protein